MSKQDYIGHGISEQARAAFELIAALADDGSDEDFTHDVIEGETNFFEAVQMALDEMDECEVVQLGCAEMIKKLSDRSSRAKKRTDKLRGLIDQAFQMAGVKTHKFATATISTKSVPRKLIVTDESLVPSRYFKEQPPKIDLLSLKADAKGGPIPGAEMSNGGITIQIRRA